MPPHTDATRPLRQPRAPRVPVEPPPVERVVERASPEYLEPVPGRDSPWPAILAGVVGLLVGALLGYAIAQQSESTNRRAAAVQTVTRTSTVVQPKVIEHSNTVTAPANAANEEHRVDAESRLRSAERENEELKQQLQGAERG